MVGGIVSLNMKRIFLDWCYKQGGEEALLQFSLYMVF